MTRDDAEALAQHMLHIAALASLARRLDDRDQASVLRLAADRAQRALDLLEQQASPAQRAQVQERQP
jgi:hypothetical protein